MASRLHGERIAVAIRDEALRRSLAITLQREGAEASLRTSASELWDAIARQHPNLLIVDVDLSGLSHIDLFVRTGTGKPEAIPILLVSAALTSEVRAPGEPLDCMCAVLEGVPCGRMPDGFLCGARPHGFRGKCRANREVANHDPDAAYAVVLSRIAPPAVFPANRSVLTALPSCSVPGPTRAGRRGRKRGGTERRYGKLPGLPQDGHARHLLRLAEEPAFDIECGRCP